MARVSRQFLEDFDLVTQTWIAWGEHTEAEVERLRQVLRVALSPGPGMPHPIIDGEPVKGWRPLTYEERMQCWSDTFAGLADEIRRDRARSERIAAAVRAEREHDRRASTGTGSPEPSACAAGPAHTTSCVHAAPSDHAVPSSTRIRSAPETGTAASRGASSHQLVKPCGNVPPRQACEHRQDGLHEDRPRRRLRARALGPCRPAHVPSPPRRP